MLDNVGGEIRRRSEGKGEVGDGERGSRVSGVMERGDGEIHLLELRV